MTEGRQNKARLNIFVKITSKGNLKYGFICRSWTAKTLVHVLVLACLSYGYLLLAAFPDVLITPYQSVQNTTVKMTFLS